MLAQLPAVVLAMQVRQYGGLPGLLGWTVGLAFALTAAYYAAKGQLFRRSPNGEQRQGPSQVRVFGLFLLIAVVMFALLLATHFVPGT
jgi:hypothetical protein